MPISVTRLNMAEKYDRKAEDHLRRAIEFEEAAIKTSSPAEREKYCLKARGERETAIVSLKEANIASGPEIKEAKQDADPGE